MSRNLRTVLISFLIVGIIIGSAILAIHILEVQSDKQLSRVLSEIKVGQDYNDVEKILGKTDQSVIGPDEIQAWQYDDDHIVSGERKNINECSMHMFLRMDFQPHRYILIYENMKTNKVQCVGWRYT